MQQQQQLELAVAAASRLAGDLPGIVHRWMLL
jgi:hypothetical protein